MLSELAMGDIADLEASGLRLTPAEIVRLNVLGLRVEHAPDAADIGAAPRIAWAGPVPVYQSTEQADHWLSVYGARFAEDEETLCALQLFACAHAIRPGFFSDPALHTADGIQAAVTAWRASLPATREQLNAALKAVCFGTDPGADIIPEPSALKPGELGSESDFSIVDAALAAGIGLSLSDLSVMTGSRIMAILRRYYANQGCAPDNASAKAHAEYIRTRNAIVKSHSNPIPCGIDASRQPPRISPQADPSSAPSAPPRETVFSPSVPIPRNAQP